SRPFSRPPPSTTRPSLRGEIRPHFAAISTLAISHLDCPPRSADSWPNPRSPCRPERSAERGVTPSVTAVDPRRQPDRLPLYRPPRLRGIGPKPPEQLGKCTRVIKCRSVRRACCRGANFRRI